MNTGLYYRPPYSAMRQRGMSWLEAWVELACCIVAILTCCVWWPFGDAPWGFYRYITPRSSITPEET